MDTQEMNAGYLFLNDSHFFQTLKLENRSL